MQSATDDPTREDITVGHDVPARPRRRIARVVTALAAVLVFVALLVPIETGRLTPGAFVRIPVEALVGVAVLLVLPGRARRVVALLGGVALGLLTVLKIVSIGFFQVLTRPFDPVFDWNLFESALATVTDPVAATGLAVGAVVLAVAVPVLVTLSVRRLSGVVVAHRTIAARTVAVLAPVWVVCAVLGAQIVPGVPVAAGSAATFAYANALQVRAGLEDHQAFVAESAVDAFRDTPGDQLLTALRGKDVVFAFVESYGRDAVEDPEFSAQVGAVLDDGTRRLDAAGFASRSAFLTSPTSGGGSWLAHSTLLSGVWIDNQQRYRSLVESDRLTLTGAFRRADWRTVGVEPGNTEDWAEAAYYGYDQVYDSRTLGYHGPNFGWGPVPDQFTLAAFERYERAVPDRAPLMVEMPLVSSHWPWAPLPRLIGWDELGDGSVFQPMIAEGDPLDVVWSDPARVRAEYRRSVEYSLNSLVSYVATYGDDDLVLVFLGDHQPIPIVTGAGAVPEVPITIVARDPAVLDRIAGWGWTDGLKPGPPAPVWPMNAFRDRFLTAFAS